MQIKQHKMQVSYREPRFMSLNSGIPKAKNLPHTTVFLLSLKDGGREKD